MTTPEYIHRVLDQQVSPDNPWQWYAVEYRRGWISPKQTCFQMHLSRNQAARHVKSMNPKWIVYGAKP